MLTSRKYQVFISSTFEDLKKQRQEIFQSLWSNDFIPVGMEGFTIAHLDQWEYLKRRIDESDYFILIVANRYGSKMPGAGNVSVTEAEYDYARKCGIPISRFVIDPNVAWERSPNHESKGADKRRLEAFKLRLAKDGENSFNVAFWDSSNLVAKVTDALQFMVKHPPVRPGFIRGNGIAEAADKYGVSNLFPGLLKINKTDVFTNNRVIRIVLNDGWGFFKHHMTLLQEALKSGSLIQIMLLHPDTISLPAVADKSFKTLDRQRQDILDTIKLIKDDLSGFGKIELLGTRQFLSYAAFIGDKKCYIDFYFNFRLQDGRQDERVALECIAGEGDSLYDKIAKDFENFWRETSADPSNNLLLD